MWGCGRVGSGRLRASVAAACNMQCATEGALVTQRHTATPRAQARTGRRAATQWQAVRRLHFRVIVTLLIGRGPILVPGNLFWCFGFYLVFEGPRYGVPLRGFDFSRPMESLTQLNPHGKPGWQGCRQWPHPEREGP